MMTLRWSTWLLLGLEVVVNVVVEAVQEDTLQQQDRQFLLHILVLVVLEHTLLLSVEAVLAATVKAVMVRTPHLKALQQQQAVVVGQAVAMGLLVAQAVVVDMLVSVEQVLGGKAMLVVLDTMPHPDTPEGVVVDQIKQVVTQEHLVRQHLMT
jgi:hypothetical protein